MEYLLCLFTGDLEGNKLFGTIIPLKPAFQSNRIVAVVAEACRRVVVADDLRTAAGAYVNVRILCKLLRSSRLFAVLSVSMSV